MRISPVWVAFCQPRVTMGAAQNRHEREGKTTMDTWRQRVKQLKQETYALYLAYRDPRVPWWARAWVALVIAYACSPIDLIPDFIPVVGYLDDLVLIPAGMIIAIKLIPAPVLADCRAQAEADMARNRLVSRSGAALILAIWLLCGLLLLFFISRIIQ